MLFVKCVLALSKSKIFLTWKEMKKGSLQKKKTTHVSEQMIQLPIMAKKGTSRQKFLIIKRSSLCGKFDISF